MKRSRINSRGKRHAEYQEENPRRLEWARDRLQKCMVCHGRGDWRGLSIHEIERRSHARQPFQPCNYLLLCAPCHEKKVATMAHARQLAVKLVCDPAHFDLKAWCAISGRRITLDDVAAFLEVIQHGEANPYNARRC